MIDFVNERPLRLQDAAELLGVSYDTVWKWTTKGHRGKLLDSAKVGGLIYTSREAIQRFSGQPDSLKTIQERLAEQSRAKAHAEAMKSLARQGMDGSRARAKLEAGRRAAEERLAALEAAAAERAAERVRKRAAKRAAEEAAKAEPETVDQPPPRKFGAFQRARERLAKATAKREAKAKARADAAGNEPS